MKVLFFLQLCILCKQSQAEISNCSYYFRNTKSFSESEFFSVVAYGNKIETQHLTPTSGYLKGIPVIIPKHIIAKLATKHNIDIKTVELAFNRWSEGPARTRYFEQENGNLRYYFISQIKTARHRGENGEFIRVVIDLTPKETIVLISAYKSIHRNYLTFINGPKELE